MGRHPVVVRLLCVGFVAALMFPLGRMIFPFVAHEIGGFPFEATEAALSATLGFSIYSALFG